MSYESYLEWQRELYDARREQLFLEQEKEEEERKEFLEQQETE